MIHLLFSGNAPLFFLIMIALITSLTFHEFGHAFVAKLYGDDTAQRMGRLTLNPLAHIDPMGLVMLVFVGFGWAKPVPTNPRNFTSRWADLWVSAAGPAMNLLLAFLTVNVWALAVNLNPEWYYNQGAQMFVYYLATINMVLMVFNLIPLGPLDGHYILPYFLSRRAAAAYLEFNARFGHMALMGLVLLSFLGIPVFRYIFRVGSVLLPYLQIL